MGIFTGGSSVRSKNIFTNISQYPTGKHEMNFIIHLQFVTLILSNGIESTGRDSSYMPVMETELYL